MAQDKKSTNRKEEILGRILELFLAPQVNYELVEALLDTLEVETLHEVGRIRQKVKRLRERETN